MSTEEKRALHNPNADIGTTALVNLAMAVGGGGGVEASERAGQGSFAASDTLPTQFLGRDVLEAAGVKFGDKVPGDEMFTFVELPAGWKKQRTDHAMWSDLLDEKGRKRASIFYKAAFYDRAADGFATKRYRIAACDNEETVAARVMDGSVQVFESERIPAVMNKGEHGSWCGSPSKWEVVREQCEKWLDERFPKWRDCSAYWD